MKISKRDIDCLQTKLKEELHCPIFPMYFDDPTHWWGQVKDSNIKFSVYIKDTHFQVVIDENGTEKSFPETDKPEKVMQAVKEFKSEYL